MYLPSEPRSRWYQDTAVADLITHLDAVEEKAIDISENPWGLLSSSEIRAIETEIARCRNDFVYAARNYFWIADDRGNETPFCLRDSQELIYARMQELKARKKPQKVLIIKSRRLGCSTLIEALIGWDTMFFTNRNGIVVSYDREHTKDLLGIMLRIYDRCPWWIKPRSSSRTFEGGLVFDNPSHELRRHDPGTQSKVMLKGANSINGVGQGYRISSAHCSEWTSWSEYLARQIIEEDLAYALQPDSFAFLESTAKGANNFSHRFWKRCEELADDSQWSPLFLPWFVDRTHVLLPRPNQYYQPEVLAMRDKAADEWVRCSNEECKKYFNRWKRRVDQATSECPWCKAGQLDPLYLTDEQLTWMQDLRNNARDDEESQKNLSQEQAGSAEESFQVSGYQVFGKVAQDFANSNVRNPIMTGFFDKEGRIHAVDPKRAKFNDVTGDLDKSSIFCIIPECKDDHSHDICPLRIWEYPEPTATYYIGADVSEGLGGNCDYSVGAVIRTCGSGIGPTYQVASWRSNRTGTQDFAEELAHLGRYYNEAEIAVEVNKYDTTLTWLRTSIQYPNLYRWKHMDSLNTMSNKIGWYTNQISRPRIHQNFRRFLEHKMFFVRSSVTAEEMKNFVKDDYDDRAAGADSDSHDDELIACFPAGTSIQTDKGPRGIETINIGDLVLTHTGRYMPVVGTSEREGPSYLVEVSSYGKSHLKCTDNHPLLLFNRYNQTRDNGRVVCWRKFKNADWIRAVEATKKHGSCAVAPRYVIDVESIDMSRFVNSADGFRLIYEGEGVGFWRGRRKNFRNHTMKPIKRIVPTDKDFCRFIGYYLAEGAYGAHNITLAAHRRELPIQQWAMGYLRSIGANPGRKDHARNGSNIYCSSRVLREFFRTFSGRSTKHLPRWTEFLPIVKQQQIIIGYLLGDGCFRSKSGCISAATISEDAAYQLFNMSIRCRWNVTMKDRAGQNGHCRQWTLIWDRLSSEKISSLIEENILSCKRPIVAKAKRSGTKTIFVGDYLVGPVRSVKKIPFSGKVYNIEVAEDNSYVAKGTVVHNCMIGLWCAYEGQYDETRGYIPLSKQSQPEECAYTVQCLRCGTKSYTNTISIEGEQNMRCGNDNCRSIRVLITPTKPIKNPIADINKLLEEAGVSPYRRENGIPEYWEL